MSKHWPHRFAVCVALIFSWSFAIGTVRADEITLDGGGVVRGKLVAGGSSKRVALVTSSGSLVVFDRERVKSVKHVAEPKPKGTKASAKPQLTPAEKEWMTKVRKLVEHAFTAAPNQRRRAAADLERIDDPEAIPALSRYLAVSKNEELRLLYSAILRHIPGPRAAYFLVRQSLFDYSPRVRDAARKAIGSDRADFARVWYIEALKTRNRNLSSLAAEGIAEIGDPDGESIPYLIAALTFQTVRVVASATAGPGFSASGLALVGDLLLDKTIRPHSPPRPRRSN